MQAGLGNKISSEQYRALVAARNKKILGSDGTEHSLQVECVRFFRMKYGNKFVIFAIPNGGKRDRVTAAELVAEGATSGIPDLCIPVPAKGYGALYIEMKNGKKGVLSDNQKRMIERLTALGNKVEVCRTFDEFEKIVTNYLS